MAGSAINSSATVITDMLNDKGFGVVAGVLRVDEMQEWQAAPISALHRLYIRSISALDRLWHRLGRRLGHRLGHRL